MHLKCSGRAKTAMNRLIAATREEAFIGSKHPGDVPAVQAEFDTAKSSLEQFIARLEQRVSK